MGRPDARRRRSSRGLVLLGLLLLLALAALGALVGAEMWATSVKREREEQLMFVGDQYRRAIESYWRASPGPVKDLPRSLDDLLHDRRFPMPVRHLRRAYRDPNDEEAKWGVVKIANGIAGVYSTSDAAPLKKSGFPTRYRGFEHATAYRDWQFLAEVPNGAALARQRPRPAGQTP